MLSNGVTQQTALSDYLTVRALIRSCGMVFNNEISFCNLSAQMCCDMHVLTLIKQSALFAYNNC